MKTFAWAPKALSMSYLMKSVLLISIFFIDCYGLCLVVSPKPHAIMGWGLLEFETDS